MKKIIKQFTCIASVLLIATMVTTTSCNKGFDELPINTTPNSGQNLAEKLNADPNFSIFAIALNKYNLLNRLSNEGNYTVLALDNATMTAVLGSYGLTPASFSSLPSGQPAALAPVFNYHVIPQKVVSSNFPTSYSASTSLYPAQIPNAQLPSSLNISTINPPGLPVQMSLFLAKNGSNSFANTVPIIQPDAIVASNGVLHKLAGPVIPPSQVLAQMIYTDPNFTYLTAAIARADSGQVGLNKLDSVLKFGIANVTVFAPTNAAFQTTLTGAITLGLIAQGVPPATAAAQAAALASTPGVFSNPALFPVLTAQTVRGIVVYHILGSRAYSVNLPLATSNIKTLLNGAIAAHPGITVDRSTATPRLLGLGNGAGNFANFTALDRNAVNGVWHVIDRVLMPQ
jgi:uncharacterized surface protein with fasciclin (FAS1) repeats